ncbi:hypothetical protein V6N13_022815 [Hibiscus sabdariffa]
MFTDTENDNLRTADNPSIRLNRDHQESAHASHADTTGDYGHPESAHASHADTAGDSGHINEQHGETRNERSEAGSFSNQDCVPIMPSSSGHTSLPSRRSTRFYNPKPLVQELASRAASRAMVDATKNIVSQIQHTNLRFPGKPYLVTVPYRLIF